jgi:hypothetical protein
VCADFLRASTRKDGRLEGQLRLPATTIEEREEIKSNVKQMIINSTTNTSFPPLSMHVTTKEKVNKNNSNNNNNN